MDKYLPLLACVLLSFSPLTADELTVEDAEAFLAETETTIQEMSLEASKAAWIMANFITEDSQFLAAKTGERLTAYVVAAAIEAPKYDHLDLSYDVRRRLDQLKYSLSMPGPTDAKLNSELARIAAGLKGAYGAGRYCPEGASEDACWTLGDMEDILATGGDAAKMLEAWTGWRTVSVPMRKNYARFVELTNQGATEMSFNDTGALWRSGYDMDADDFAAELDRVYAQVLPLYEALHCHVRAKLNETFGDALVPLDQGIPAHLLGNMWAQDWSNIYDLVAPGTADPGYDLGELLRAKEVDALGMVRYGEGFFTSLGFEPLPRTFWKRSLFEKPRDREVVCHASAWDVDDEDDLRIKMCIEVNAEDFETIHHELGHNFYQRAYNQLPYLYRNSANDGFHEALGDTIGLSVTPAYLVTLGLLEEEPDPSKDLGLLMKKALEKVAFFPFSLVVDQWRWQVFSGEISVEEYNQGWWNLREKYQGVVAPVERSEANFDPGAKYHVPANTPYTRYFLAGMLQFQFHRSLCEIAEQEGPLNRCSIYANAAAGKALQDMMAMGKSRPWPEALEALTGSPTMDATAVTEYFAPLKTWLDEQNAERQCGW